MTTSTSNPVTTSIVVQFTKGAGSSGDMSAEIDSRPDGLNGGKTQFMPGDTVGWLLFKTPDVVIDGIFTSASQCTVAGPMPLAVSYQVTEAVAFLNTDNATVPKPVGSNFTYQWIGNNLGAITVSGKTLRIAAKGVGVALVTYNVDAVGYTLSSPSTLNGKTEFQVYVVVVGHSG